jgi:hypothetical protein
MNTWCFTIYLNVGDAIHLGFCLIMQYPSQCQTIIDWIQSIFWLPQEGYYTFLDYKVWGIAIEFDFYKQETIIVLCIIYNFRFLY